MARSGRIITIVGALIAAILLYSFLNWKREQKFNTITSFDACTRAQASLTYETDAGKICETSYRVAKFRSRSSRRTGRRGRESTTRIFFERSPNDIFLTSPARGIIPSPVCVAGRARENWFRKNQVRVKVLSQKGLTIGEAVVERGYRYADDFYAFKTKIPFTTDESRVWVALERDDPETPYGVEIALSVQVEHDAVRGALESISNTACF